ncbi:hypothetical protein [Salinibacter ruber]|jgi:hypothetical protein|uniref:hypothetical protein n=1 Tax=Salinibacter ruber TaxID=146919 RepID=UPI000E577D03|nr:hypothetical protein [Salinibacter ruber]MCS3641644.1 hypothetical protein [Salinibacter ruber]MCS3683269.1 hypothetical protein [Salinibacter ruber]MCS3756912.1 hypothetical protein [Salinibacter ruber]MCS3953537.1 hypothetical protein [Salinibacter ruber]MCS4088069.1 hypothetical protein [Salinibacter ruber]
MLPDESIDEIKAAVQACDDARAALVDALDDADTADDALADSAALEPVGQALADWRDAQARFMAAVDAADASDPATTALLLKTNHGVDASNARCGIPGTDVEGADQPFPLDLTGAKGMLVTQAATEHLD